MKISPYNSSKQHQATKLSESDDVEAYLNRYNIREERRVYSGDSFDDC